MVDGVTDDNLMGAYVPLKNPNGYSYLQFLRGYLTAPPENIPLEVRSEMWYIHNESPALFSKSVCQYLDATDHIQRIERRTLLAWPPQSSRPQPLGLLFARPPENSRVQILCSGC